MPSGTSAGVKYLCGQTALEPVESEELSIDWAARSLGLDLGYPYLVNRIDLHVSGEDSGRFTEERLRVFVSMSNLEESYEIVQIENYDDSALTISEGQISGTVTIEFSAPIVTRYRYTAITTTGTPNTKQWKTTAQYPWTRANL